MRLERIARVGALALMSVTSACVFITQDQIRVAPIEPPESETDTGTGPGETSVPELEPGNLLVQVLDSTGRPAAGVAVTLDDDPIGVTDAAGYLSRRQVPEGWHALGASVPRGVPTGGAVEVVDGQTRVAVLRLPRPREGVVHVPSKGGAISRYGEYSLVFDDDAFDGAPDVPVTVSYAWVDRGTSLGPAPLAEGGVPIDLVAVAWIGEARAGGETYEVKEQATGTGTLRISAPPGDPLQSLPAPQVFRFDAAVGVWRVTAPADLEDAYLTGQFDGPGWWALGTAGGSLGCLSGTLSPGADSAGALLTHLDPTRPLATVSWADTEGGFCISAVAGQLGHVEVRGANFDGDQRFGGGVDADAPSQVAECGGACRDLTEVALDVLLDGDDDGYFGGIGGDCDDADENVSPALVDAVGDGDDQNCDGVDGTDADHDGVAAAVDQDCDDADASVALGLPEVCDDADNDCDDRVDLDVPNSIEDPSGRGCLTCGPQTILDLGPKLYLTFDEVTGTTSDYSGFGFDGDVAGLEETRYSVAADEVPAPFWGGTRTDHVLVSNFSEFGGDAITVSMFIRPSLSRKKIVSYAVSPQAGEPIECAANQFGINVNPTDVSLKIRDWSVKLPGAQAVDAWEHLVVTWRSNGTVVAYKNNVKFEAVLTTDGASSTCEEVQPPYPEPVTWVLPYGGALVVGGDQDCEGSCVDTDSAFEGVIDEVAIFDRVLTEEEVTAIYESVTCGEGLACDDEDDDGDGLVDEHLLGSDGGLCLAQTCEEIADNLADVGESVYWVNYNATPTKTTCSFPVGGDCACRVCGDGIVADVYESCEGETATCDDCAFVPLTQARSCAEVLEDYPAAIDGVYWIYSDPLAPTVAYKVRCNFSEDDGGWTLVVNQDTRPGTVFYDPVEDPPAELIDDRHTWFTSTGGLVNWRAASVGDPFAGSYSLLGQLETFRGACGFEFRMVWPFDGPQSIVWKQTSDPTMEDVLGYQAIRVQNLPTVPFRGLKRAYYDDRDPLPADGVIYPDSPPPEWLATARVMGSFDAAQKATWFPIGVYPPGIATDHDYRLWASPDISPDGTVRGSELWVRPCTP